MLCDHMLNPLTMKTPTCLIASLSWLLLFVACHQQPQTNQGVLPKPNDAANSDQLYTDSLHHIDSVYAISLHAYAGAYFGMHPEELLNTDGFSGGLMDGDLVHVPSSKRKVGNYAYDIKGFFHEHKLYMVTFESAWYTAADIEFELVANLNNLKEIISIRYGQSQKKFKTPNVMEFEPGTIRWVYIWEIDSKEIRIGMQESPKGSLYRVVMWIVHKPVFDLVGYRKSKLQKVKDAEKF